MTDKPTREEALKALSLIDENESKWESNQFEKEILIIRNYINSQEQPEWLPRKGDNNE